MFEKFEILENAYKEFDAFIDKPALRRKYFELFDKNIWHYDDFDLLYNDYVNRIDIFELFDNEIRRFLKDKFDDKNNLKLGLLKRLHNNFNNYSVCHSTGSSIKELYIQIDDILKYLIDILTNVIEIKQSDTKLNGKENEQCEAIIELCEKIFFNYFVSNLIRESYSRLRSYDDDITKDNVKFMNFIMHDDYYLGLIDEFIGLMKKAGRTNIDAHTTNYSYNDIYGSAYFTIQSNMAGLFKYYSYVKTDEELEELKQKYLKFKNLNLKEEYFDKSELNINNSIEYFNNMLDNATSEIGKDNKPIGKDDPEFYEAYLNRKINSNIFNFNLFEACFDHIKTIKKLNTPSKISTFIIEYLSQYQYDYYLRNIYNSGKIKEHRIYSEFGKLCSKYLTDPYLITYSNINGCMGYRSFKNYDGLNNILRIAGNDKSFYKKIMDKYYDELELGPDSIPTIRQNDTYKKYTIPRSFIKNNETISYHAYLTYGSLQYISEDTLDNKDSEFLYNYAKTSKYNIFKYLVAAMSEVDDPFSKNTYYIAADIKKYNTLELINLVHDANSESDVFNDFGYHASKGKTEDANEYYIYLIKLYENIANHVEDKNVLDDIYKYLFNKKNYELHKTFSSDAYLKSVKNVTFINLSELKDIIDIENNIMKYNIPVTIIIDNLDDLMLFPKLDESTYTVFITSIGQSWNNNYCRHININAIKRNKQNMDLCKLTPYKNIYDKYISLLEPNINVFGDILCNLDKVTTSDILYDYDKFIIKDPEEYKKSITTKYSMLVDALILSYKTVYNDILNEHKDFNPDFDIEDFNTQIEVLRNEVDCYFASDSLLLSEYKIETSNSDD